MCQRALSGIQGYSGRGAAVLDNSSSPVLLSLFNLFLRDLEHRGNPGPKIKQMQQRLLSHRLGKVVVEGTGEEDPEEGVKGEEGSVGEAVVEGKGEEDPEEGVKGEEGCVAEAAVEGKGEEGFEEGVKGEEGSVQEAVEEGMGEEGLEKRGGVVALARVMTDLEEEGAGLGGRSLTRSYNALTP